MTTIYIMPKILRDKFANEKVKKIRKKIYELRIECHEKLFQHAL